MKLFITIILTRSFSFTQKNEVSDKNQLAFWIGKWQLEWTDKDGFAGKGSCEVKKIISFKYGNHLQMKEFLEFQIGK